MMSPANIKESALICNVVVSQNVVREAGFHLPIILEHLLGVFAELHELKARGSVFALTASHMTK